MYMTFQEKSLWVTFVGMLLAFGAYFRQAYATLLPTPAAKDMTPDQAALFMAMTVLLVVILIAGHVAIVLFDRRAQTDERDRWIALRGSRNGSYVLASGVFLALCTALFTEGNAVMAHVLLCSWVLAQGVEIVSQLVLYRQSA